MHRLDPSSALLVVHVGGGVAGLASGVVAAVARKGGALHRTAGRVFVGAMGVMAIFAGWLAVVVPGQQINLVIAPMSLYLVVSGWMAAAGGRPARLAERLALAVSLLLWAPFALLSMALAIGAPPPFKSAVPLEGPVLIAVFTFTLVLSTAAATDLKVVLGGGVTGADRMARHLWRMAAGLSLAAGSAFTNGLPRLLPGPTHVTPIFFVPQFLPVVWLIVWQIRLRRGGWRSLAPFVRPAA